MSDITGNISGQKYYPLQPSTPVRKEAATKEATEKEQAALQKACRDFESYFLYSMLKNMDKTVMRGPGSLDNSRPMQFYREMLYEKVADAMSEKGIGIADTLQNQMQQQIDRTYK